MHNRRQDIGGDAVGLTRREAIVRIGGAAAAASFVGSGQGQRAVGAPVGTATTGRSARPNILFIMTDDQRYDAMSCAGNEILKTPNMDRLAEQGLRFRNAFVTTSLCGPSRASILTGQYAHTTGVRTNRDRLRPDAVTFPRLLQQAGYRTGIVGKWHLRITPPGFDYHAVLPGQGRYQDPLLIINGERRKFHGHCTDVITDRALEFLRQSRSQPFCLLLHYKASHRTWIPAERFAGLFRQVTIPEPETFHETYAGKSRAVAEADMKVADMKDFRERGVPQDLPAEQRKRGNFQALVKYYYRTLAGVDENLGRVLRFLDEHGLTDNTLVIYTSDNGFFLGEHGFFDKRLMYEESIRVPLLVRYPRLVRAGASDEHMVLNIDLCPTILALAGVPIPPGVQGMSLVPLLQARAVPWRESFLYEFFEFPGVHSVRKHRGVRTERWKYIHFYEPPEEFELYDLQADPHERRNLYGQTRYAEVVEQLRAELVRLRAATKDPEL